MVRFQIPTVQPFCLALRAELPWQFALLWHGLHQCFGELENVSLNQTLHDLQELLHDHRDALVPSQLGHATEVGHSDKT